MALGINPIFILVGGRNNGGISEKEYKVVIYENNSFGTNLKLHTRSLFVYPWADIDDLKYHYINYPMITDFMLCGEPENYYLYS